MFDVRGKSNANATIPSSGDGLTTAEHAAADERYGMRAMKICEGHCLPTLRELFRGASFCNLDMTTDMSRVARIIYRRYGWLAKINPVFARALGWTKAMADQQTIDELPFLEAAVRRLLGRFDKIRWPTGPVIHSYCLGCVTCICGSGFIKLAPGTVKRSLRSRARR